MNFDSGIYNIDDKKKLKEWLESVTIKSDDLIATIERLDREIEFHEKRLTQVEFDEPPVSYLDFENFKDSINWLIVNGVTIDDEGLMYLPKDRFTGVDSENLNKLLDFFINKVHNESVIDKELYCDQVDAYNLAKDLGKYFLPLERFIFKKFVNGVWYLFDYYEVNGQGTSFNLTVYADNDTERYTAFVEEMMRQYFIKNYCDFESHLIEC